VKVGIINRELAMNRGSSEITDINMVANSAELDVETAFTIQDRLFKQRKPIVDDFSCIRNTIK